MLDIAGGIVIGGLILGLLYGGLTLAVEPKRPGYGDASQSLGWFMAAIGAGAAFWVIFVHSGIIRLPI